MCGICGILNFKDNIVEENLLKKMNNLLSHRGPDEEGYFVDKIFGVGIRRLSIIDLEGGKQPIFNEDKNLVIVYNGEIYNYKELRENLTKSGHRFYTKSDTEVIIHLFEEYGEECLKYLRGMFSFAIWNRNKKELFLARDELGIKPLYYSHCENCFVFASEIKSILSLPFIKREVSFESLNNYLTYLYDPTFNTMFKGIKKLMPGEYIYISKQINIKKYFLLNYKIESISENSAVEKLDFLLRDSVKKHLISDVEVGSFLSGGIDSSLISAISSKVENKKIKTFSIGFEGNDYYNELPFAKKVADDIKSEHYEFIVKPDAVNILPKIIWHFDEPLADASAIPNYYVADVAKNYLKVVLTGLGGDELFGGYLRYAGDIYLRYYRLLPNVIKTNFEKIISSLPSDGTTKIKNYIRLFKKFTSGLNYDKDIRYLRWNTYFNSAEKKKILNNSVYEKIKDIDSLSCSLQYFNKDIDDFVWNAQYLDLNTYLPGDLLFLTDRITMANSIEGRVPYIDKELVNFAFSLPSCLKIKNKTTKYILKRVAKKYLRDEIINREKHGFAVPIDKWLKKDLKNIFKKIFSKERVKTLGYFNFDNIFEIYNLHLSGKEDKSQYLWALLIFDIWHKMFIEEKITSFEGYSLKDLY